MRWAPDQVRSPILDIGATFLPKVILALSRVADAHTASIQRVRLCKVNHAECHILFGHKLRDIDGEVEPLMMATCVCIDSHIQIVAHRFRFDDHVEVARLEG